MHQSLNYGSPVRRLFKRVNVVKNGVVSSNFTHTFRRNPLRVKGKKCRPKPLKKSLALGQRLY